MDKNCRKVAIITDNPGWHGEQLRKSLKGRDLDSVYLSLSDCSIEITGEANDIKLPGSRSHFFSKFNLDLVKDDEYFNDLEINIQRVSNPTYLEVHELQTKLADFEENILKTNSILVNKNNEYLALY